MVLALVKVSWGPQAHCELHVVFLAVALCCPLDMSMTMKLVLHVQPCP